MYEAAVVAAGSSILSSYAEDCHADWKPKLVPVDARRQHVGTLAAERTTLAPTISDVPQHTPRCHAQSHVEKPSDSTAISHVGWGLLPMKLSRGNFRTRPALPGVAQSTFLATTLLIGQAGAAEGWKMESSVRNTTGGAERGGGKVGQIEG